MSGVTKALLREQIAERRRGLTPAWCLAQSAMVQARLLALPELRAAGRVGLYLALPGEVDMDDLLGALLGMGRGVCVPAFDREGGGYGMAVMTAGTRMLEAPFGLREPEDPVWVDPATLDAVVVPGLAFDAAGRRVGHGGGHYDRMLAAGPAYRIGAAFDFQMFSHVPAESHDVAMDCIVTQTQTVLPQGT
ncbi:MAG: 5-formyltetrahydrofolate cyclo-ligase [Verrucomicrobia bacterium]|jgi:5-formyltetrahydrofolate cyclo-ligase|nr:5-formyltetrahydrofolate cyclo-ligase [Verrucomicrobiota bacterium]MBT7067524.1 5-formyltetrahydrofolate cyclo-ligase [Verrucomicrobiota bacterium]MBT7699089.1 5-formyltetrahydrofolate cyclo-ligase [Verrucomicrobiota bacterium]